MTTFMYTSEYDRVESERDEARMWARRMKEQRDMWYSAYHDMMLVRDKAARLCWNMKQDRDGYRELYHEMQAANLQAWDVAVQRLQRIGELERENENRRAFTDTLEEVKNALRHRIAELESQLAARNQRTCATCAMCADPDRRCDGDNKCALHEWYCEPDDFCSRWQERTP